MSDKTQDQIDDFLAQHADDDGNVPDDILLQAMTGDFEITEAQEGATAADETAATNDEPAGKGMTGDESKPEGKDVEPMVDDAEKPVVLTKDGKHTIPYEHVEDLRSKVDSMTKALEDQTALIEKLQAGKEDVTAKEVKDAVDGLSDEEMEALDEEFPEFVKLIRSQQATIAALQESVEAVTKQTKETADKTAQEEAWDAHMKEITTAHKDFDALMDSGKLEKWVETQPSFVQRAFNEGTASEVVEVVTAYKSSNPAQSADDTDKKVDEAIANAKASKQTVTSLSQVPGARTGEVDESNRVENMSELELANKMLSMEDPSAIEAYLSRVL